MNYCRTCKYWATRGHAIGVGLCVHLDVQMRIISKSGQLFTCQDFGCVLHEEGQCGVTLETPDGRMAILSEFMDQQRSILGTIRDSPENIGNLGSGYK